MTPAKPALGFDLRFHAGYEVTVPLKELGGEAKTRSISCFAWSARTTRTSPFTSPSISACHRLTKKPRVTLICKADSIWARANTCGLADARPQRARLFVLLGSEAVIPAKDRPMSLAIAPGAIQRTDGEQFKEEPPVQRVSGEPPLNVKVLVNFAPSELALRRAPAGGHHRAGFDPAKHLPGAAHRQILGVAFNMQEQKVVYRQEGADRIDFPALGEAVNTLNLGTVDLKRLGEKHGDTEFLADLVRREVVSSHADHPDAVHFRRSEGHAGHQSSLRMRLKRRATSIFPCFT